jgi:hypothetical protein
MATATPSPARELLGGLELLLKPLHHGPPAHTHLGAPQLVRVSVGVCGPPRLLAQRHQIPQRLNTARVRSHNGLVPECCW